MSLLFLGQVALAVVALAALTSAQGGGGGGGGGFGGGIGHGIGYGIGIAKDLYAYPAYKVPH